jgi:hypothetical protein
MFLFGIVVGYWLCVIVLVLCYLLEERTGE